MVTVILMCFNQEETIGQAIESVLAQSYGNFELLICDDASTDSTQNVAKRYSESDSRITFLGADKNLGIAANVNRGLSRVQTQFVAWLAGDDCYLPTFLEDSMKLFEQLDSSFVFVAQRSIVRANGHTRTMPHDKMPPISGDVNTLVEMEQFFHVCSAVWRHDSVTRLNSKYKYSNDYRFFIDLVINSPHAQFYYYPNDVHVWNRRVGTMTDIGVNHLIAPHELEQVTALNDVAIETPRLRQAATVAIKKKLAYYLSRLNEVA